jgi:hypothetical protein
VAATEPVCRRVAAPASAAATPAASPARAPAGALVAAALALPGIVPAAALAQTAPDAGVIELKYLDYRDWQPGADRMAVRSPSFYLLKPLSDTLAVEAALVHDAMSGASPLYFNTLSGASGIGITEYRTAGDVKVTQYFNGAAVGVGGAVSSERDYLSRAFSLDVRFSTADRNRTYAFGLGGTADTINSVNGVAVEQHRNSLEYLVGVTQVLSADTIVQSNLTYYSGHGYYSDPYKPLDDRPDRRRILAWLTRYNRHFADSDGTLRLSYRYLHDSFGSVASALEATWVQPLPHGWSAAPGVRYYTQSAADFYLNPPFPAGYVFGQFYTADTRLSAFGAFTAGVNVTKALSDRWSASVKLEFYRQRPDWRIGGSGSPGIEPFSARWIEVGITKTF